MFIKRAALKIGLALLFGFVQPVVILFFMGQAAGFFRQGMFLSLVLGVFEGGMIEVVLTEHGRRISVFAIALFLGPILGVAVALSASISPVHQIILALLSLGAWAGFSTWVEFQGGVR